MFAGCGVVCHKITGNKKKMVIDDDSGGLLLTISTTGYAKQEQKKTWAIEHEKEGCEVLERLG
jgi:hypothetical protein